MKHLKHLRTHLQRIPRWRWILSIGILIAVLSAGWLLQKEAAWFCSDNDLEPWEKNSVSYWSALLIQKDKSEVMKLTTEDSPMRKNLSQRMNSLEQHKPGKVYVASLPDNYDGTRPVMIIFDPQNIPPKYANVRWVDMKNVNGKWLVYQTYAHRVEQTPEQIMKDHKQVEWKEACVK